MKHVICCGLAVLDHVFYLPEIPKTLIKSFATNYHPVGGGNAATAAVALSWAGGQAGRRFFGEDFVMTRMET